MEKYIVFSNNKMEDCIGLNSEYSATSIKDACKQHIGYGLPEGEEITLIISRKDLEKKWSDGLGFYDTYWVKRDCTNRTPVAFVDVCYGEFA